MKSNLTTFTVEVKGRVQGVGYRAWVEKKVRDFDLQGWVMNSDDKSVKMELSGKKKNIKIFLSECYKKLNENRKVVSGINDKFITKFGKIKRLIYRKSQIEKIVEKDNSIEILSKVNSNKTEKIKIYHRRNNESRLYLQQTSRRKTNFIIFA